MNTAVATPDVATDLVVTHSQTEAQAKTYADVMRQHANEAVRRAEVSGLALDFEVSSLATVAEIARKSWKSRKRAWHRSSAGKIKPEQVANMLGAYVGELMVAERAAVWIDEQLLICGSEALNPSELVLNHMRRRTTANLENVIRYFIGQEIGHDFI